MKWVLDPVHSAAAFAVRHMGIAFVRGKFNMVKGTIHFDPPDVSTLSAEGEVEVASLGTGIEKRDAHLKSPDFFYGEKYPKIFFKGSKAEPLGNNKGRLTGDLTIRGITRPIIFEFEYSGPVKAPFGEETSIGFTATAKVRLLDFDLKWNEKMPEGGFVVGPDALLTLDVEADLAEK